MDDSTTTDRRRLLGLLGCGLTVGLAASDDGGVPAEYETATSIGGTQRDPDAVSSQSAVNYQSEPKEGQQCSNCQFYIEDKNGDGMGACAIVAGTIDPEGYCVSYAEYQG
mgnify:CR=1 FL=1